MEGSRVKESLYSPLKGRKPRSETELRACKTLSQTISNSYPDSSLYSMQTEWTEHGGLRIVSRAHHRAYGSFRDSLPKHTSKPGLFLPLPPWHFLTFGTVSPTHPSCHPSSSFLGSQPTSATPSTHTLVSLPEVPTPGSDPWHFHSNVASLNLLFALLLTFWAPQGLLTSFSVLGT